MAEPKSLNDAVFEAWRLLDPRSSCLASDNEGNIVCKICHRVRCENGCGLAYSHSLIQTTGEFVASNRYQDSVDTSFDATAADSNLRQACTEWLKNDSDTNKFDWSAFYERNTSTSGGGGNIIHELHNMKKQLWDALLAVYEGGDATTSIAKNSAVHRRRVFSNLMHLNLREWDRFTAESAFLAIRKTVPTAKLILFFEDLLSHIPDHVWRSQTDYIRKQAARFGDDSAGFGVNTDWSENGDAHPKAQVGAGCISICSKVSAKTMEKGVRSALAKLGINFPAQEEDNDSNDDEDDCFDDEDPEPLVSNSLEGYTVELHLMRYDFAPTFVVFRGQKGDQDAKTVLESAAKLLAATFKGVDFSIGVIPFTSKTILATIGNSKMNVEIVCGGGRAAEKSGGIPSPGVRMELKNGNETVAIAILSVRNCEVGYVGPTVEVIAVLKPHRRKGIGSWLLAFVENWVLQHWITRGAFLELSFCEITGNFMWFKKRGIKLELDEGMKVLKKPAGCQLVL